MSVFYAYSNNRDETRITYEKVCDNIDNIIDVCNNDPNNSNPDLQNANGSAPAKQQQMQQQHAISYVTTIRNRFANEPDTYRSFLKILHTYQKVSHS